MSGMGRAISPRDDDERDLFERGLGAWHEPRRRVRSVLYFRVFSLAGGTPRADLSAGLLLLACERASLDDVGAGGGNPPTG